MSGADCLKAGLEPKGFPFVIFLSLHLKVSQRQALYGIFVLAAAMDGSRVLTDISTIKQYWASLQLYEDGPQSRFGVKNVGLPQGCQVEQVQIFHRHSARYPSSDENVLIRSLAAKIVSNQAGQPFTGPLSFLNQWTLQTGGDVLTPVGVSVAYASGTGAWTRYGRLLYNATPGQSGYVATSPQKPLLRSNTLPRVLDTAKIWAEGFFGPYNATSKYSLLQIPFSPLVNSSLSSFLSCSHYSTPRSVLTPSQAPLATIAPLYLGAAKARFSAMLPPTVNLTEVDLYAMQALCVYEYHSLGSSDFCRLFTLDEWKGFEYLYDSFMYNRAFFGNPAGRALGIGFLQEILARFKGEYITTSETSINSTLDSNPDTFPLDQKIYLDTTNDFMILGTLTAMSLDYFKGALPLTYPPPPNRRFRLSTITRLGGRLVVEKIGCATPNPAAARFATQYSNTQYGYSASNAPYKFVRMRLGNSIVPLDTIRGGACKVRGRTDGLCSLDNFVRSQATAVQLANYQFVCFGNYTYDPARFTGDGSYYASS
jgi:hypothetical protein